MITKTHPYTYRQCDPSTISHVLLQAISKVQLHVRSHGYRELGEFPTVQALAAGLQAATQSRRKRLMKHAEQLHKRVNLRKANQFLHQLCVQLLSYGPERQVARVDVSAQEAAIRAARKAWVKARGEAEALRLAYLAEKGDFYKRAR